MSAVANSQFAQIPSASETLGPYTSRFLQPFEIEPQLLRCLCIPGFIYLAGQGPLRRMDPSTSTCLI